MISFQNSFKANDKTTRNNCASNWQKYRILPDSTSRSQMRCDNTGKNLWILSKMHVYMRLRNSSAYSRPSWSKKCLLILEELEDNVLLQHFCCHYEYPSMSREKSRKYLTYLVVGSVKSVSNAQNSALQVENNQYTFK